MIALFNTLVLGKKIILNDSDLSHTLQHIIVDKECGIEMDQLKEISVGKLAEMVNRAILRLYGKFLSKDGSYCDYKNMAKSKLYKEFCDLTTLLKMKHMDLGKLSEKERKCFALNLYNAGVIHATIKLGEPKGMGQKTQFYRGCCYQIGETNLFSLDDLEHGILRCNAKHSIYGKQFGKKDARLKIALKKLDPRIHFCLVCGAKSCPPIRIFKVENLELGLDAAAASFFRDDSNFSIEGKTIYLSKILSWYGQDFGSEDAERLKTISQYIEDDKARQNLQTLIRHNDFQIKFNAYDWSLNGQA